MMRLDFEKQKWLNSLYCAGCRYKKSTDVGVYE